MCRRRFAVPTFERRALAMPTRLHLVVRPSAVAQNLLAGASGCLFARKRTSLSSIFLQLSKAVAQSSVRKASSVLLPATRTR